MKKVTVSQIKGDSFNLISVVEECIEISPADVRSTCAEMENIFTELIALDEALFFKKEKLSKKLVNTADVSQEELMNRIQKGMRLVKLEPLGNAKNILETNKNILELKNMQKILRYSIELDEIFLQKSDNSSENKVLTTLLNSDIKEDWEFLCTLLYYYLKFGTEEQKSVFMYYSKKIEEKMSNLFEESLKIQNFSGCRAAYRSLEQLGKQTIIFEKYINSFDIFQNSIEVFPPTMDILDFDNFIVENNTFATFFQALISNISENSESSFLIFGDEFTGYFYEKVYRSLIFKALERFLKIDNPCLFLFSLYFAYSKVDSLTVYLSNMFNPEPFVQDAFSQYFSNGVQKEKECFDIIFNILIGEPDCSGMQYILLGEIVRFSKDYRRSFEKILAVVHLMKRRSKLFYSEEDEAEILRYSFRKVTLLIDKVVVSVSDKIEIICILSYMYLISKKYLQEKFYLINTFTTKINDATQTAFNDQINYINLIVKGKISNLFFLEKTDYKKLLGFLKESIKRAEVLKGRNYNIFTDRILTYTYKRLYKQICTIVYNSKQCENLLHVVDEILGYVMFINRTTMVHKFTLLKNICILIACPRDKFIGNLQELEDSISEKEVKDLLKCRADRDAIKSMIFRRTD